MKAKTTWQEKKTEVLAAIRTSKSMNDVLGACGAILGRKVTLDGLRGAYKVFRADDVNLPTLDALLGCELPEDAVEAATKPTWNPYELETRKLRRELKAARQAEEDAIARIEMAEERVNVALAIAEPPSPPRIKARGKRGAKREATAVAMISDTHCEERVDPATVNGKNEYNLEIADSRFGALFEGIRWSIEHHRNGYSIEHLVPWFGGDLITGYIHEELVEANYLSPTQALLWTEKRLMQGIDMLKELGAKLTIPCSYGNHGRTTQKKRVQTAAQNSFEWLMYQSLKKFYANDDQVEFIVADGAHLYLDIYDWTLRFHHGDHVNYWGGVGGLTIPMRKAIDSWNDFKHADITCVGHFHQFHDYRDFVVNGSLVGYNAFALSIKARYERPMQAFFLVDEEFGKVQVSPIICA